MSKCQFFIGFFFLFIFSSQFCNIECNVSIARYRFNIKCLKISIFNPKITVQNIQKKKVEEENNISIGNFKTKMIKIDGINGQHVGGRWSNYLPKIKQMNLWMGTQSIIYLMYSSANSIVFIIFNFALIQQNTIIITFKHTQHINLIGSIFTGLSVVAKNDRGANATKSRFGAF